MGPGRGQPATGGLLPTRGGFILVPIPVISVPPVELPSKRVVVATRKRWLSLNPTGHAFGTAAWFGSARLLVRLGCGGPNAHVPVRPRLRREDVPQETGVCDNRHRDARARHRLHRRNLQRRQRGAARAVALRRARPAGARVARPAEPQRHEVSVGPCRLPRSAHAGDDVQGSGRVDDRTAGDRGRRAAGGGRADSNGQCHAQPLPVAGRASRARQRLHRRRRHAAAAARRRARRGRGRHPTLPPPPQRAILSYEFWQRRFGANPSTVGSVVALGQQRLEVVGVLEPGFELLFPPGVNIERAPDVWTPMRVDFAAGSRVNVAQRVIARLRDGVDHRAGAGGS